MDKNKIYNYMTTGIITIVTLTLAAGIYNVHDIKRDLRESREDYRKMMGDSAEFSKLNLESGSPIEALIKKAEDAGLIEFIKKE